MWVLSNLYYGVSFLIPYLVRILYPGMHQVLLSCRAWIILTFPGRWFSCVGNAFGSARHRRHCTLGCIAYSRLLHRFSPLRPLSSVPGTHSRRPSSRNGPGPFWHLHPTYFTQKKIYGVWGMVSVHCTVWNGWFTSLCCSGCGFDCPHFPSLRYIRVYTLLNLPLWCSYIRLKWLVHDLMLQWLWCWFALMPVCPIYYLPHDVLIFQLLRRRVLYPTAVQIRAQYCFLVENGGSSWNFRELWPSEKGVNSKGKPKKKTCPWLIWSRLSQRYMARFGSCA